VGTTIHLTDPLTLQHCEMTAPVFWRSPFNSICTHGGHIEFVVLDIEPLLDAHGQPICHGKVRCRRKRVGAEKGEPKVAVPPAACLPWSQPTVSPVKCFPLQFMLAEAQVARDRDLGVNDHQFITRTHLGNILHPGDKVWG
jgi:nonsense-mediated mRNA decay protein 3